MDDLHTPIGTIGAPSTTQHQDDDATLPYKTIEVPIPEIDEIDFSADVATLLAIYEEHKKIAKEYIHNAIQAIIADKTVGEIITEAHESDAELDIRGMSLPYRSLPKHAAKTLVARHHIEITEAKAADLYLLANDRYLVDYLWNSKLVFAGYFDDVEELKKSGGYLEYESYSAEENDVDTYIMPSQEVFAEECEHAKANIYCYIVLFLDAMVQFYLDKRKMIPDYRERLHEPGIQDNMESLLEMAELVKTTPMGIRYFRRLHRYSPENTFEILSAMIQYENSDKMRFLRENRWIPYHKQGYPVEPRDYIIVLKSNRLIHFIKSQMAPELHKDLEKHSPQILLGDFQLAFYVTKNKVNKLVFKIRKLDTIINDPPRFFGNYDELEIPIEKQFTVGMVELLRQAIKGTKAHLSSQVALASQVNSLMWKHYLVEDLLITEKRIAMLNPVYSGKVKWEETKTRKGTLMRG